jgi:hypothetical protein
MRMYSSQSTCFEVDWSEIEIHMGWSGLEWNWTTFHSVPLQYMWIDVDTYALNKTLVYILYVLRISIFVRINLYCMYAVSSTKNTCNNPTYNKLAHTHIRHRRTLAKSAYCYVLLHTHASFAIVFFIVTIRSVRARLVPRRKTIWMNEWRKKIFRSTTPSCSIVPMDPYAESNGH